MTSPQPEPSGLNGFSRKSIWIGRIILLILLLAAVAAVYWFLIR